MEEKQTNVELALTEIWGIINKLDAEVALRLLNYISTDIQMRIEWINIQQAEAKKESKNTAPARQELPREDEPTIAKPEQGETE